MDLDIDIEVIENEVVETEDEQKPESTKRSPWAKKPMENVHASPAGPCVSIKDRFNSYLDDNYKKMSIDDRNDLWKKISFAMISTPLNKINDVIEANI